MSSNALILCVDDEPINLTIMEELLQDRFALDKAESGSGCLLKAGAHRPDLILLDVDMPEMDGLETCRRLKTDPDTADIPVIFVSALASQSELMAGYEAGGDDYITKPFSEAILAKKIDVLLASQRRQHELEQISERAVEDLKDKISITEQLGFVLRFLTGSRVHGNLEALVHNLFDCLRQMTLDASLMIVDEAGTRVWFSDDIDRPMERQILESLHGQDRIVRFGTRLAVSAENTTLLVRNLPDGREDIARLRELLTILIGGLDARVRDIYSEQRLARRREAVARVLAETREHLLEAERLQRQQNERAARIVSALNDEFGTRLGEMDLEPSRESDLREFLETACRGLTADPPGQAGVADVLRQLLAKIDTALDDLA